MKEAEPGRLGEIIQALDELAIRESKIHKATHDLSQGRNQP
jgi:hypothetical protein